MEILRNVWRLRLTRVVTSYMMCDDAIEVETVFNGKIRVATTKSL